MLLFYSIMFVLVFVFFLAAMLCIGIFTYTYFGTIFIFKHVLLKLVFSLQRSNLLLQFKKVYMLLV
jgi:hypothetical protein